jgi:hypothetical protein
MSHTAPNINMPGYFYSDTVAAPYGQTGERDMAGKALRELLVLKLPDTRHFDSGYR